MLYIKAFHIVFVVAWFAGFFYLPRLFVYHAMTTDTIGNERFKVMERKLFWGIMTPCGVIALLLGYGLMYDYPALPLWLHLKLGLVALLVAYHIVCGWLMLRFRADRNTHSHIWYRWFNEIPLILLIGIVILVVVKPLF
jgi:protoporphyrinogen IX oxidase